MILYSAVTFVATFVLAVIFRRRIEWVLALLILVRILVPPAAVGIYFWKIHPTILMVLAVALARLLFDTDTFLASLRRSPALMLATVALGAYGMLDFFAGNTPLLSLGMLLTTILVAPVLLYTFVRDAVVRSADAMRVIAWPVIAAAVGEVILGQMQLDRGEALVWQEAYRASWWWDDNVTRALGTTGHGLQLGILMAVAATLLFTVPVIALRVALLPILLYGTIIGSARTAFVLVLVVGLVVLLVSLRKPFQTLLSVTVVGLVAATYYTAQWEVVSDLVDKFGNDGYSTQRRVAAIDYFMAHRGEYVFLGYKGPRDLMGAGVLKSSLENGYLALAMVFGILFAVLYTLMCVALALGPLFTHVRAGAWATFGGLVCLVGFASGNSLLSSGIETVFFWVIAGAGAGLARRASVARRVNLTTTEPSEADAPLPQWRRVARGLA